MLRRAFLACAGVSLAHAAKGRLVPSELRRYADPTTEFPVERLTSPEHACFLPAPNCRAISRRGSFAIYAGDRDGSLQLYRLDARSGTALEITSAKALVREAFSLLPGDRSVLFFDGPSLRILTNAKEREVYRVREGWRAVPTLAVVRDGGFVLLIETRDGASEVRSITLNKFAATTVLESAGVVDLALSRPSAPAQVAYRREGGLWMGEKRLAAPAGVFYWRRDGETLLYLSPEGIRELDPDTGADKLIVGGRRFAHFAPNADASVFVVASGSLAQPHLLLALRSPRRELTLCEHRAHDAASTAAVFSPDSHRVWFQSDGQGKPALYSVVVERLVEET